MYKIDRRGGAVQKEFCMTDPTFEFQWEKIVINFTSYIILIPYISKKVLQCGNHFNV